MRKKLICANSTFASVSCKMRGYLTVTVKWTIGTPNWMAKKRDSFKSKYSWIAKTNSDGTPIFFPVSSPEILFSSKSAK